MRYPGLFTLSQACAILPAVFVLSLGLLLQGCDEGKKAVETVAKGGTTAEAAAPAEEKREPKWTPAGTLREIAVITIAEHVYSRIDTTEGSYYVEGFVSAKRGDECQVSDTGLLDIKGNLNYFTILGL